MLDRAQPKEVQHRSKSYSFASPLAKERGMSSFSLAVIIQILYLSSSEVSFLALFLATVTVGFVLCSHRVFSLTDSSAQTTNLPEYLLAPADEVRNPSAP